MARKKSLKDVPEWAMKKIKEARESHSKGLDLSNWRGHEQIYKIPDEVFELSDLQELRIGFSGISIIPEAITRLRNLSILDASRTPIRSVPTELQYLPNLKELYMNYTMLEEPIPNWMMEREDWIGLGLASIGLIEVPDWLSRQSELRILNLAGYQLSPIPTWLGSLKNLLSLNLTNLDEIGGSLTEFPYSILHLTKLRKLSLLGFQFQEVPEAISGLTQLEGLYFAKNSLSTLPASMSELKNIRILNLDDNLFRKYPDVIFQLFSLESLSINNFGPHKNSISEIPSKISQLKNLRTLSMIGNPVTTPPKEVVDKGIDAIREYYRQAETQGTDELYEAKLLLVGEPGAGKTSLTHKIQDPDYILQPKQESTKGIEIAPWRFYTDYRREFRVNLWDFGGQEIYHATHQYFLTKRSLYLLVSDTRQEDTDFEFWLNVIELLGGDSPVLIIQNEKQERHRELDERLLRGRFKNLKEILATNLETNRGLERIRDTIQYYLRHLPHIGTPLPKNWVKVRSVLESDLRSTISLDEYLYICKQNGFDSRADALQLSGYLHDLGVCLHFQDDLLLKHLVILKTQWGTDAAYKVLDNPTVINNLGVFTRNDLQNIWDQPEYHGMHDELLQLMMKFRLCYRIPSISEIYIAPQLLSPNRPEYTWEERDNLHMRYSYEFMPKGLLTQLIVALHERVAGHNLLWRNGVVLEDEFGQARAEVIEYYQKREIHIRVSGVQKKELLTIVTYELEKIHRTYSGLKYDVLIPCNCTKCREKLAPHFYHLETLKHFLNQRQLDIQCQISFQMIGVHSLINDVLVLSMDRQKDHLGIGSYYIEAENLYLGPVDQRLIDINTGGGAFIGGNANVGGDLIGRDLQKVTFQQVYEAIQNNDQIKEDDKPRLQRAVEAIEEELKEAGEEASESFLARRFKIIASMAPDILDVALAAAINPMAGFTEAARKIAKRAADQVKAEAENNK